MRHTSSRTIAVALVSVLALAAVARADDKPDQIELLVTLGQRDWSDRMILTKDGVVTLHRSRALPQPRNVELKGRATPSELSRVFSALEAADLSSLPRNLVPEEPGLPAPGQPAPVGFVQVGITKAGKTRATIARLAEGGIYGARLAPLVESLRAIVNRVSDEGLTERYFAKVVVKDGSTLLEIGATRLEVTNEPFKGLLGAMKPDTFVTVLARDLERNDHTGTVEVLRLEATAGPDGALVRWDHRALTRVEAKLAPGDSARVMARHDDWLLVEAQGQIGWVKSKDLQLGTHVKPAAGTDTKRANTQGIGAALPR